MPFLPPNQQRQSTEGKSTQSYTTQNLYILISMQKQQKFAYEIMHMFI